MSERGFPSPALSGSGASGLISARPLASTPESTSTIDPCRDPVKRVTRGVAGDGWGYIRYNMCTLNTRYSFVVPVWHEVDTAPALMYTQRQRYAFPDITRFGGAIYIVGKGSLVLFGRQTLIILTLVRHREAAVAI